MSSPPYPSLQFDQQAAQEAINALQAAYTLISEQTGSRQSLGNQALANWQGKYAEEFRADFAAMLGSTTALLDQLQQTVQAISQASTEATQQTQANAAWQQQQQVAARTRAAQAAQAARDAYIAQLPGPPAAATPNPVPPEPGTGSRHF